MQQQQILKLSLKASYLVPDLKKRQRLAALVVRCLFSLRYKVQIRSLENVQKSRKPLIIAANHPSRIDPFLLSFLPSNAFRTITPIRFMMAEKYFKKPWYWILSAPFGAYPLSKWSLSIESYLQTSHKILEEKGVVMIFPEGRLETNNKNKVAKPGAVILAKIHRADILPMHISFQRHSFLRKKITISFGEPYQILSEENETKASAMLIEKIYKLNN